MTDLLKQLLHTYGLLHISVTQLEQERPGNKHDSLHAYYQSLGASGPDEPVVVVRISRDNETQFISSSTETLTPPPSEEYRHAKVTVMELPEDEFYFFQAFRPGMFDLQKQLPPFVLQMMLVYCYTLFETYVTEIVRMRLRAHPAQIGLNKQVTISEVLDCQSKENLIEELIDREVNRLMHEPISSVLGRLRTSLGFRVLTDKHDQAIRHLSLTRNCLLHNSGKVDPKLAAFDLSLSETQVIHVSTESLTTAITTCRKFCAEIDRAFVQL